MIPHVGLDIARTKAALASMRYAPDGARPTCSGVRSADFGLRIFADIAAIANTEVLSIGLIEDAEVLNDIDVVLAECKLDVVIPGPGDLAMSLGVPGQLDHPLVNAAVSRVIDAAKRAGSKVGVYVLSAESAVQWQEKGVDLFLVSIDQRILANAYRRLRQEFADTIETAALIDATKRSE